MALTPIELFRAGNKTTPRFEHLKVGEVVVQSRSGVDWVLGSRVGGASTLATPIALKGTWYRLPQGTIYDSSIFDLWNDYPGHWSWEPAQDMLLDTYVAALAALNAEFILV
jgi:hypothetical protein